MQGLTSEAESDKLRQCLLEIAECKIPNLYYETEKHMLIRCWLSCCGSRCLERCRNSRNFIEKDARDIYAIHCRIPVEKEPEISTKPVVATETGSMSHKEQAIADRVKEVKAWMS